MQIRNVCLLGGTGFVGQAIADQICARGIGVRVLTRSLPRAMPLAVLPTCTIQVGDPHDPATLEAVFRDMDAVINLVGIIHEKGPQSFRQAHAELPGKVVEACRKAGVQHLLHMSALGASSTAPSEYQRTRAAGEEAVRGAPGDLAWTIFRPSVIFGEKDRFLNLFAKLVRAFPVVPLAGAKARFQPVWVEDVARAFVAALGNPRCFGQAYELCGPRAYSLEELVRFVGTTIDRKPRIVALGSGLGMLQATVLEHLPGRLMTRDNLRSMSVDNVCSQPFPEVFGFEPSPLEAVVPEYMAATTTRARYARYRNYAGR
jgi:uncharacterized protein YbjT (DUF2867 family)